MNIKELLSNGTYRFNIRSLPHNGCRFLVLQIKVGTQWFDVKPEELMGFIV